jgi:branched-chain amino acid transport system ATP-binding protein
MTMLSFSEVGAGYGQTRILEDVSFSVDEGAIVALIGRNGVGKTTLMKTAIGLLYPRSGTIHFKDDDITMTPADHRARAGIGYVPQGREVFPRLTVAENLRLGNLVNEDSSTEYLDEVFEYFPILDERRDQRAGSMSGGEQQMLAIGRALVGGPDLLLLDEPSEGVQPSIVQQVGRNITQINEELGTTILFSEQNLDFTTSTAERVYVMDQGTIVNDVVPDELHESEVVQKYLTM